jgi:phosphatidylglycerophosphate synthase
MKKITFIMLFIAAGINTALGLTQSKWNYLAAIMFAVRALFTYLDGSRKN